MKTLLLLICSLLFVLGSMTVTYAQPYAPSKHNNIVHHHKFHKQFKYDSVKTDTKVSSELIEKARGYIGTNPTGWASVWCGKFMRMMVSLVTGKDFKDGNSARNWADYGKPGGPEPGNLVVFSRGRHGGHVGIVTAVLGNGRIRVLSGNHSHRVAEAVYSTARVIAYRRLS